VSIEPRKEGKRYLGITLVKSMALWDGVLR